MALKDEYIDGMDTLSPLSGDILTSDEVIIYRNGRPFRTRADVLLGGYKLVGYFDYNDAATASTPISVTADTETVLTNDTLGEFTTTTYKPSRITRLWNASTNRFDFSELNLGDMVDIRIDIDVTTTNTYQEVSVDINLGVGEAGEYKIPILPHMVLKTVDTYKILRYTGIHMGNTLTKDYPASVSVTSDANCTVKVNGWYCKVLSRLSDV